MITRRGFARRVFWAGAGAAGWTEAALAQRALTKQWVRTGVLRLPRREYIGKRIEP